MKARRFAHWIILASLAAGVAAVPTFALAQPGAEGAHGHRHPRHGGLPGEALIHEALALDSLSSDQRSSIEGLAQFERTAALPVKAAEASVLTALAGQVEAGSINEQAVAPLAQTAQAVRVTARAAGLDATQKLHDVLTPAQRDQVVASLEAKIDAHPARGSEEAGSPEAHGPLAFWSAKLGLTAEQQAQIAGNLKAKGEGEGPSTREAAREGHRKWLEAFRASSFSAAAAGADIAPPNAMNEHIERVLEAVVPVLTPAQRTQVADALRRRAAHGQHG